MRRLSLLLLLGLASCSAPARYAPKTQLEHSGLVIAQVEVDRSRTVMADPVLLVRPGGDAILANIISDLLTGLVQDKIEIQVSYDVAKAVIVGSDGEETALAPFAYVSNAEEKTWVHTAQPGRYRLSHVVATPVASHRFDYLEIRPADSDSIPDHAYIDGGYLNQIVGGPITLYPPTDDDIGADVAGQFEVDVTPGQIVFLGQVLATEHAITVHRDRNAEIEVLEKVLRAIRINETWKSRPWIGPLETRLEALGVVRNGS